MQDLSHLADDSLWPTSQAGGNMMSGRAAAMSAPGSQPTDPLPPAKDQGEPKVIASNSTQIKPGTTGRPKTKTSYSAPHPSWSKTTQPEVVRKPES